MSIYIKHKDWEGVCLFNNDNNNNYICRENVLDEKGKYNINFNKLTIKWEKWNEEDFYNFDNSTVYYYKDIFENIYNSSYVFYDEYIYNLILDKNNNKFIFYKNNEIIKGNYIIDNDLLILNNNIILKNIYHNIYCYNEDFENNKYYELKIIHNSITESYIFNTINKYFYNSLSIDNIGKYEFVDNLLIMKWNNGNIKKLHSNKYISYDLSNKNIYIIKPIHIFMENRVLFSNISLCKKNIILTSMHYKTNKWDLNCIDFHIPNCNIIKKTILNNDDEYESSSVIILELDQYINNLFIKITYKSTYHYNIYLEQLNILEHKMSAMTLFKDDYNLLERYLKYYSNLGIEVFYLYYNKKIDNSFIEEVNKLNANNVIIYLIEWNYIYWWKDNEIDKKYHHSQLMAINDALNVLKNYTEYILYNDLDEYINCNFENFNKLIDLNKDIDLFIFKNQFCKMTDKSISFKTFDKIFDLNNIIKGNYYDEFREKTFIKCKNIKVMGVHKCFKKFSKINLKELIVSNFYHFVNFEEKNREYLMYEYIY